MAAYGEALGLNPRHRVVAPPYRIRNDENGARMVVLFTDEAFYNKKIEDASTHLQSIEVSFLFDGFENNPHEAAGFRFACDAQVIMRIKL